MSYESATKQEKSLLYVNALNETSLASASRRILHVETMRLHQFVCDHPQIVTSTIPGHSPCSLIRPSGSYCPRDLCFVSVFLYIIEPPSLAECGGS